MTKLRVYVPREASSIAVGSAVVGQFRGGRISVDYEGDIYRRGWSFADCLHHAAGRHLSDYPTVARAWLEPDHLVAVGWYEPETRALVVDDELAAFMLAGWIGVGAETCEARLPGGDTAPLNEIAAQAAGG